MTIHNGAKSNGANWFTVTDKADTEVADILIYDAIGKDWWDGSGVGAEDFAKALKAIPSDRKINVRINSPGGNVYDGIAIYTMLKNRGEKVTTSVEGIAASIASVIAIAGHKVVMAKAAQYMVHDPSTIAVGTEAEMEKAISALRAAKESILVAYSDKTKKTKDELSAMMTAETWFTGESAKAAGFVDELTDAAPVSNSFDLSSFRRVPDAFRKPNPTAASNSGQTPPIMDKAKLIALLKRHGVNAEESATIEQLEAQLETALQAKAKAPEPKPEPKADASAERIAALEAKYEAERKTRIASEVDNAITERRITAAQRETWIARAVKDETILADLRALEPKVGDTGSRVFIATENVSDIAKHANTLRKDIQALAMSGSDKVADVARDRASFIAKNKSRFIEVWNEGTNTIDSDLKQDVLLSDALIQFKRILLPLTSFAKNIGSVPMRGTTTIRVPFIPEDTVTSTTWNASNGYVAGDTAVEERSLALTRYYKAIRFTADELARQPYLMLNETYMKAAEKLGYDVWLGFLAQITVANFATVPSGFPMAASAFDSNVVANLRNAANAAQWPFPGRVLIVNSDYDNALLKDNAVKSALQFGSNGAITDGSIQKIMGFNYFMNPNWPTNSESLVGIIAQENALLIGSSPIAPTEEELRAGLAYNLVSDADTGISLEYKSFGQPQMNRAFRIIEANWAVGKGNALNLQRLTSA